MTLQFKENIPAIIALLLLSSLLYFLFLFVLLLTSCNALSSTVHASQCGDYMCDTSGVISSPNYPSNYYNFGHCIWLIQAPSGHVVSLNISHLSLEQSGDGSCIDYVWVRLMSLPNLGHWWIWYFIWRIFNIKLYKIYYVTFTSLSN